MVKINQMKKDELFEGFYLSSQQMFVRPVQERITLPLYFKTILERLKENYGMRSPIM